MFCQKCGYQVNDDSQFCPSCGNPVTPAAGDTAPYGSTGAYSPYAQPQQQPQQASPYTAAPGAPEPPMRAADPRLDATSDLTGEQPPMYGQAPYGGYPNAQAAPQAMAPKKKSKAPIIIVIAVVAAVIIGVVVFMMMNNNGGGSDNNTGGTQTTTTTVGPGSGSNNSGGNSGGSSNSGGSGSSGTSNSGGSGSGGTVGGGTITEPTGTSYSTLEGYFDTHSSEWTDIQNSVEDMSTDEMKIYVEVDGNEIIQIVRVNTAMTSSEIANMKQQFDSQGLASELKSELGPIITSIEEQTHVSGVSWYVEYQDANGNTVWSTTVTP